MPSSYPLFSVIGIEIEYMLVEQETLNVSPKSDALIEKLAGQLCNEWSLGPISISNELVLHVLELKNTPPLSPTMAIAKHFQDALMRLSIPLAAQGLMLLPTAAHPWMNPNRDTQRWPHDNWEIYQTYDQIFNCQGHGWSNLQSMHVNLPFSNENEFNLLHNAIRLLLPLLPAIAASSPILEGRPTGYLDTRLQFYNDNQKRIPLISGEVIPEFISSEKAYNEQVLKPMYEAISPFDPDGHLQYEWLNSRGAIPKFESGAIEIRLLDTQECIDADLSLALAVYHILKSWVKDADKFLTHPCPTAPLRNLYQATIKSGLNTRIEDRSLLAHWQLSDTNIQTCRDVWYALLETHGKSIEPVCQKTLKHLLSQGNLSERILRATGQMPSIEKIKNTYQTLAACLLENRIFQP